MCHRRIDEIPGSIIGASHKPETVIVAEEDDVTIAVATKYHSLIAHRGFTPL
jgi:hypothetical protein